ncbi:MAG: efflux RND transporter periplasmic adaptor subunit [Acidobacteriota bacterium]
MTVRILKIFLPILLVGAGVFGAWKMVETRPEVVKEPVEMIVPTVRAINVKPESVRLSIYSQGTVTARTETDLVAEIPGKVLYVSPSLAAGGFFEKDHILLRIDPHDYELALTRSRAEVAQAELRLEQERAEAEVAAEDWAKLGDGTNASPLVLREPQVAQANAAFQAAQAALEQAKRDLERTEISAPFHGRVSRESVDVGQYVTRVTVLARLYSIDVAEVRLPIPDKDLAYVDIPLSYRYDENSDIQGPEVHLRADWAGSEYVWKGRIVRTEGEIDSATRMLYAVAQVQDPYAHGKDPRRPPLAVGMFVRAEILGNLLPRAFLLPRAAVRGSDTVYVIDSENRLRFRHVEIFKRERERVIVRSGLEQGDVVCVSPLETVADGMEVKVVHEEAVS